MPRSSTLADGTRAISLSQFLAPSSPVTWRGTAVEGFLLFLGARLDLTGIDTIVFDLPPGAGDVERAVMKYARPTARFSSRPAPTSPTRTAGGPGCSGPPFRTRLRGCGAPSKKVKT